MFPKFIGPNPKPLDASRNGWSSIARCEEEAKRSFGENMEADPILFRDLTYVFLAATLGGLLAWRLKLPLILGFVVGGIVD